MNHVRFVNWHLLKSIKCQKCTFLSPSLTKTLIKTFMGRKRGFWRDIFKPNLHIIPGLATQELCMYDPPHPPPAFLQVPGAFMLFNPILLKMTEFDT